MKEILLTFSDFQRMLLENSAKPIWEKTKTRYKLMWSAGSFLYVTYTTFPTILKAYRRQTGNKDAKLENALNAFEKRYLADCLESKNEFVEQEMDLFSVASEPERKGNAAMEHSEK